MSKKEEYRITPIGEAKYFYGSEPDTRFDPDGVFHCSLQLSKEEAEPEIKAINSLIAEKIAEIKKANLKKQITRAPLPYKDDDGKILIKFKSKFKPKGFDKANRELPKETIVYKGSTMRIKYKLQTYDQSIGVGCSLYLLSFQVDDLVEGQSEVVSPFKPIKEEERALYKDKPNVSRLPGPEVKAVY